jgi:hypothetical protein
MARRSKASVTPAHPQPLGHLEECWDEPLPNGSQHGTDLQRLQGVWVAQTGRRPATFIVSGNHFTIFFLDGDIYMGRFDLGLTGLPLSLDFHIEEGPPRHKGQLARCYYEVNGDHLLWCTGGPGGQDDVTEFPSPDDPRYLTLMFRRVEK